MRILIILAVLTLFASCKNFDGKFEVQQLISFNIKSTVFGSERLVVVDPGIYDSSLEFKSKTKAFFVIKTEEQKYKIVLKMQNGESFPQSDGEIFILGGDINQPWDARGEVASNVSRSEMYREYESCTYTELVTTCYPEHGHNVCHAHYVTRHGRKRVEYYVEYNDSKLYLNIIKDDQILGTFKGNHFESERVYDFIGECF